MWLSLGPLETCSKECNLVRSAFQRELWATGWKLLAGPPCHPEEGGARGGVNGEEVVTAEDLGTAREATESEAVLERTRL